jgi:anti-anti-sigma factor
MDPGTDAVRGLSVSCRTENAHTIAALSGEPGIACGPALREQLLGLLRPAASRLVIGLSRVSYAHASGLAVLGGTGRRAGLPGGYMRLAVRTPGVAKVLRITGLHLRRDIFPTVQAAITSPGRGQRPPDGEADADIDTAASPVHTGPRAGRPGGPGTRPAPVNSARQPLPCSRTSARGVTPAPAAGLPPPCTPWPAAAPAPAAPPCPRPRIPFCPSSPVSPSPTPRQSPRPPAVFAASSTRSPARPHLRHTRARATAWSGSSPSASGT